MRSVRFARIFRLLVGAAFLIVAAWLFLGGEHVWSFVATLVGVVVTASLDVRKRERAAERQR